MRALAKSFLILYCILFAQDTKMEAVWVRRMCNVGQFVFKMQHSCKSHGPFWLITSEQAPGGFKKSAPTYLIPASRINCFFYNTFQNNYLMRSKVPALPALLRVPVRGNARRAGILDLRACSCLHDKQGAANARWPGSACTIPADGVT